MLRQVELRSRGLGGEFDLAILQVLSRIQVCERIADNSWKDVQKLPGER
jgi:hypothetical protein